jgi:hypothetical protein
MIPEPQVTKEGESRMADNWWAPWTSFWGGANAAQPLAADVSHLFRLFSPSLTVNGRGDPEMEQELVRDVATYGSQLSQLIDIALAFAHGTKPPEDSVATLEDIKKKIEAKKTVYREGIADRARNALQDLRAYDTVAYDALLAEHAVKPVVPKQRARSKEFAEHRV